MNEILFNTLLKTIFGSIVLFIIGNFFIFQTIKECEKKTDFPYQLFLRFKNKDIFYEIKLFYIDHKVVYRFLVLFIAFVLSSLFINIIKDIDLTTLFDLTLTVVLVSATLSLLTFTYALVLKNEERDTIIQEEIKRDIAYKNLIFKKIKEKRKELNSTTKNSNDHEMDIKNKLKLYKIELYKKYSTNQKIIDQRIKLKINLQIRMRNSGESFLMSTILASIGFLMIYASKILSKIPFEPQSSYLIVFKTIVNNPIFISLYYYIILFILVWAFLNFIKGLLIVFGDLLDKFGELI